MKKIAKIIKKLPQSPGVYLFFGRTGEILYIGKAINLRSRVRSHFNKNSADFFKGDLIKRIANLDWIITKDEKQALLLENQLIKKYQPRYNIQWRDDKSYFHVAFTPDEWPRVQIVHQPSLRGPEIIEGPKQSHGRRQKNGIASLLRQSGVTRNDTNAIGPFVSGRELKQTLRALRKIFPFRTCKNPYDKPCLQAHLGLCAAHKISNLRLNEDKAHQRYANLLNALFQILRLYAGEPIRVEAYDISNIQGTNATASMIVFDGAKPKKLDYRRFRIKTVRGANDIAMIKETLRRRLNHPEWPRPDLILIDGGRAQLNAALSLIVNSKWPITDAKPKPYAISHTPLAVIALAKREDELYTEYRPGP